MAKMLPGLAAPFLTTLLKTWVEPKLTELAQKSGKERKLLEHALTEGFSEYFDDKPEHGAAPRCSSNSGSGRNGIGR